MPDYEIVRAELILSSLGFSFLLPQTEIVDCVDCVVNCLSLEDCCKHEQQLEQQRHGLDDTNRPNFRTPPF